MKLHKRSLAGAFLSFFPENEQKVAKISVKKLDLDNVLRNTDPRFVQYYFSTCRVLVILILKIFFINVDKICFSVNENHHCNQRRTTRPNSMVEMSSLQMKGTPLKLWRSPGEPPPPSMFSQSSLPRSIANRNSRIPSATAISSQTQRS